MQIDVSKMLTEYKEASPDYISDNGQNSEIIALLMGSAYLTDGEVKILCNRKISSIQRGLSSNEIMTYLYLKLHSQGGIVRSLSHAEICDSLDISPRDVYHVLGTLNRVGLIGIEGKPGLHYKNIRIRHYSGKAPSRFLSLNRTFFHDGEDDYASFKKLSAGAKSAMIYLLSREKFWKNNLGQAAPKSYGNSIEVSMVDIVKSLGVQRDTAILYLRELNDAFHDFFNVVHALNGTLNDRRLALIQDKRVKYGGVVSNAARRWLSTLDNKALGFWRLFDQWLTCHGYSRVPISSANTLRRDEHIYLPISQNPVQRNKDIRSMTFTNIIRLLQEGISSSAIYRNVVKLISSAGGLSDELPYYLYASLSPNYCRCT